MDTYSGLYYPFIHFKDEQWLKLSALYWDKMARIVPAKYPTEDGATVKELSGFIDLPPNLGEAGIQRDIRELS
jgi:hypothetical protein